MFAKILSALSTAVHTGCAKKILASVKMDGRVQHAGSRSVRTIAGDMALAPSSTQTRLRSANAISDTLARIALVLHCISDCNRALVLAPAEVCV